MSGNGTGNGGFGAPAPTAAPTPAPSGGGNYGSGNGGFGAPGVNPAPVQHASGGGGFLHSLGSVGHFISSRLATGASTVKSIGTGLYDAGKVGVAEPWWNLVTTGHPYAHGTGQNIDKQTNAFLGGSVIGPVNALKDIGTGKFKDPIGDLIMLSPAAHGLGRSAAGASEAGAALRAGEGARVAAGKLKSPSLLSAPRLVGEPGREPVSLYASHNAARRLVQAGIDRTVNKALANDRAKGILGHEGPIASYGKARMGGTVADYARASIRYRQAMIATTRVAGRGVEKFAKSIKADVADPQLTAQALLHSLHDNVLPEHEAIMHEQKAAEGVNPEQNKAWAQAFNDAASLKAVHLTDDNRVVLDDGHPLTQPLAHADSALEKLGAHAENQIIVRGLRDPLDLADRRGRVAQLVQRGNPLQGEEPKPLTEARRSVANVQKRLATVTDREQKFNVKQEARLADVQQRVGGRSVELGSPHREKIVTLGHQLEAAQQRVQSLEDRYGYSSPERRAAIQQGHVAREQVAAAAHESLGAEAPQHLAQLEGFARQFARTHDLTPEEFYSKFYRDGGYSPASFDDAWRSLRDSLTPTVAEIARRMYAPDGWDQAAEEKFVGDMGRAANGEKVSPEAQRLFLMTHQYTQGRGYVPMTVWEDARQSHAPMASSVSPIVGDAKKLLNTHLATGEATSQGLRRTDVGDAVTSHVQKLFRYFNTVDHRDLASKYGSDTRMSKDDVLVRYDRRTEAGFKLPAQRVDEAMKETLGILENRTALPAPEEEGLSAGVSAVLHDFVGELFPHLGSDMDLRRLEETSDRGTQAPAGYKWVPSQIARLKDLEAAVTHGEPSRIGRFADNVNGAVTAATVYYKIGHFFTRYLTNAATNIMQGSAAPWQIARSVSIAHELTDDEMSQALAYAGTHYYEAAPGATGSTVVGKGMQKGLHIPFTDKALRTKSGEAVMSPQFWAHHVDAPFRFNSIAYEARQAGYEGVEGFRQFLSDVEGHNELDAVDRAKVEGVLRRADREAIAYDRMNQFEKKWLTRIVWFYPWVKGSTVFTGNAILEHPFKSAALYGYGEQGSQERDKELGDLPSYEQGLTPLTHGAAPIVADLNTFNPFSTAADLAMIPAHDGLAGMANPFYGAIGNVAEGVNPYGAHTPHPVGDNLKGLLASTPEFQVGSAASDHADQSHRLFPGGHGLDPLYKNWLGELVRSLGGPATPRHVNPDAGHSLAQRERTGR